jgi:aspartyl-tRNA synthetase
LDGSLKSSVDKFYDQEDLLEEMGWSTNAKPGDLILVLSGNADKTRTQLSTHEVATRLELRKPENSHHYGL